jgi:Kelch motif/Galactose oxidase, central domain
MVIELDRLALLGVGRVREHPRGTPKNAPSNNPQAALSNLIDRDCSGKMAEKVVVGMSEAQASRCSPLRFTKLLNRVTATVGASKGTLYIYEDERFERVYVIDEIISAVHPAKRVNYADTLKTIGEYPQFYDQPKVVALVNHGYFLMGQQLGERWEESAETEITKLADFNNRPAKVLEEPPPLQWDAKRKGWRKLPKAPACQGRWYLHTLTVLSDSRVLVAGGLCDVGQIANEAKPLQDHNLTAIWNPKTRGWESSPKIARSRIFHSANLLPNGGVLLVGGRGDPHLSLPQETALKTVEIIKAGSVVDTSPLDTARAKHTATLLNDGSVLVVGGVGTNGRALASTEKWNQNTGLWQTVAPLKTGRYAHSATLLADGRVLVVGGIDPDNELLNTTEIYDPAIDKWLPAPSLPVYIQSHAAALLSDGKVFIVGGQARLSSFDTPWGYTWLPSQQTWQPVASIRTNDPRALLHRPSVIPTTIGGATIFGSMSVYQWGYNQAKASESEPIWNSRPIGVALADGQLLAIGTEDVSNRIWTSKLWDPKTNTWSHAGDVTSPQGGYRSAIQTPSGQVLLVAEGRNGQLQCQLWNPKLLSWEACATPNNQFLAAAAPGMQWLADRRVGVVANGSEALIFDETQNQWTVHKLEHSTKDLAFGQSISAGGTPLFSFVDPSTEKRIDLSDAGARNWQQQFPMRRNEIVSDGKVIRDVPARGGAPALLWDSYKNRWAYILERTKMSTRAAFMLNDGCALSWMPFKLFDPSNGAITELPDIANSLKSGQSDVVLLKDSTVAILGVSKGGSSTETTLITQQVSCKGWAKLDSDALNMPSTVLNEAQIQPEESAIASVKVAASEPALIPPKSRAFDSFWQTLKQSRAPLITSALLILSIFAVRTLLIRRKAAAEIANGKMAAKLARAKARNAESHRNSSHTINARAVDTNSNSRLQATNKSTDLTSTKSSKANEKKRDLFWYFSRALRIIALLFIVLFALNVLSVYLIRDQADTEDECRLTPSKCLSKENQLMTRNPNVPGSSNNAQPRIPCSFVGIWGMRFKGRQLRFDLNVDGSYEMTTPIAGEVKDDKGFWVVQGNYMIWRSSISTVRDADINLIFSSSNDAFSLIETNGIKSEFQRTGTLPNAGCSAK